MSRSHLPTFPPSHVSTFALSHAAAIPKILDFGLAKLVSDQRADAASVTLSDEFIGTPAYASPEQMRLANHEIDVRTDVYSLGVILFEMLTGRLPYETPRSLAALIEIVQQVDPIRPAALNKALDRDLEAIVLKTLEKDRDRRYPSIDALLDDVQHYRSGLPIAARPPSAFGRVRKFVRRNPLAAGALAALAIGAVGYVVTTTWLNVQKSAALKQALEESERLRQVNQFSSDLLLEIWTEHSNGVEIDFEACIERAAAKLEERFVNRVTVVDGNVIKAKWYERVGQATKSLDCYQMALANLKKTTTPDRAQVAELLNEIGQIQFALRNPGAARGSLLEALEIRRRHLGPDSGSTLQTQVNLARVLIALNEIEGARSLLEDAVVRLAKSPTGYVRNLGVAHKNLAFVYSRQKMQAAMRKAIDQALVALRSAGPIAKADLGETLHIAGECALADGDLSSAVNRLSEATQLLMEAEAPPTVQAACANRLGEAAFMARDWPLAEKSFRQAIERWDAAGPDALQQELRSCASLAKTLEMQERIEEARDVLRTALQLARGASGMTDDPTPSIELYLRDVEAKLRSPSSQPGR